MPSYFSNASNYKTNSKKKNKQQKKQKSLAEKLKHVALELISSNQTTYVKNQCISESGRLIPDVIEICDILDIPSYNRYWKSVWLLSDLKKFGFGENFICWIKILLND